MGEGSDYNLSLELFDEIKAETAKVNV